MFVFRSFFSALIALALSTNMALAEPVAQVVRLSGQAELTRGQATAPIALGTALEPGDLIKTDATGRVRLHFIDGSTINLGSQSDLRVELYTSGGPGTERQGELALGQGALRAEAAPAAPKSRLEIRTPLAVTAVRGTQWGILSTSTQSDVLIFEGRVGIRRNIVSGESGISITAGRGIAVTADRLGPIGRLSPERVAAFEAATSVPGADIPFNLGAASLPVLTPILRAPDERSVEPATRSSRCRSGINECELGGRGGERSKEGNGGQSGGGESGGGGNESEHGGGNNGGGNNGGNNGGS